LGRTEVHVAGRALDWGGDLIAGDPVGYHARRRPTRLACIDLAIGTRLTYAELDQLVSRCCSLLIRLGVGEQARIALLGRNSVEAVVLAMACQRLGAIFVPLNWRLVGAELEPILQDAAPDLLVVDAEFQDTAEAIAGPVIRLPRDGTDGLLVRLASEVPTERIAPASAQRPCILLYTSGTTGRPKGVIVTCANAFYAALNFAFVGAVGPATVALLDLPMFHTIGLVAVTRTTLTLGGTLVISDRFVPDRSLAAMADAELGVTHYFCVPQMAAALREHPAFDGNRLSRLEAIFVGGAPVPKPLIEAWLGDGVPLVNGFGMTEAGTVIHVPVDKEAVRANPGALGLPAPLLEVKLVDLEGHTVEDGLPGELWLKGPSLTPGYWRQPEASAAAFSDGWYRTGDLLVREPNGYYRLVDRLKDMYISGGENVYPGEVEAVLLSHPEIAEAAVVGVPDARWGETGVAHVVLRQGSTVDAATLLRFCAERLATYKRPASIVLCAAIPRTASGKILKHILRARFQPPTAPSKAPAPVPPTWSQK